MMYKDFRNQWLFTLGQRLNIPELAFDEDGWCQMSFDDELTVAIFKPSATEDLVVLGQLPVAYLSAELMQQMLKENRNHSHPSAAVISLSENLDSIELHFKLTTLEMETVDDVMDLLIGHLEYWRGRINGG